MLKTRNGKVFDPSKAKEINAGGEGKVLELSKTEAAKVYFDPKEPSFEKQLISLQSLGTEFVKPRDVYFNPHGKVAGFSMDYVNLNHYFIFSKLFDKNFCTSEGADRSFKIGLLEKLRKCLEDLHSKNIQFGDVNQYNLFFSLKGDLLIIDVDSFQTPTQKHSGTLMPEVTDWKRPLYIDKESDTWAYDVLAFWCLTNQHPFKYVLKGDKNNLQQRVEKGLSILSNLPGVKLPAVYEPLPSTLSKQFEEIFGGRRYMVDLTGTPVTAPPVWFPPSVQSTALTIKQLYEGVLKVNSAVTRISMLRKDGNWVVLQTDTLKIAKELSSMNSVECYPLGRDIYSTTVDNRNTLFVGGKTFDFIDPVFYHNNGHLSVFDQGVDIQYNFNLHNQDYGADYSQTPVYTKSIIVRDTPIQYFGGSTYLNIPMGRSYYLMPVPRETKNAVYENGYVALEVIFNNQVKFYIWNGQTVMSKSKELPLDYLPYFAVKKNTIFVPEDGFIHVYNENFHKITEMECSVCTRSSRLYSTDAGLLLLDNNVLYLLNTK